MHLFIVQRLKLLLIFFSTISNASYDAALWGSKPEPYLNNLPLMIHASIM